MIVFQVSLNFDPLKEILRVIWYHIYILMNKKIILTKTHTWWPHSSKFLELNFSPGNTCKVLEFQYFLKMSWNVLQFCVKAFKENIFAYEWNNNFLTALYFFYIDSILFKGNSNLTLKYFCVWFVKLSLIYYRNYNL